MHFIFIAILGTLLSSCMVGPDFQSPKPPMTRQYTPSPLPIKTVATPTIQHGGNMQRFIYGKAILTEWWQLFHSPALNALVQQGLEKNPSLVAAKATLLQAKELLNAQIGSTLLPTISGSLSGQRQRTNLLALGQSANTNIYNLYNASVPVSYTFDLFGGARRQIEAVRAQAEYEQYELDATYLTLTSNIVTTAITIASLSAQIAATHDIIQSQERQLKIMKKQLQLGGESGANVYSQEAQVEQSRATLPPLQQSLAQSLHALAVLIGDLPSESQLPKFNLANLTLPSQLPVSLPSDLVRQRPDIRASEALLHAANAQIGVAVANMYPQITLSATYGWQALLPSGLFKSASTIWNIGTGVAQPIFNGGALTARKRAAIAGYEVAAAEYRQTVLQAFQNVADTLRALENDARALNMQKRAEKAAYRSLKITQQQYQFGGTTYLALLTAQRQYQQARISRIQAQAARYSDTAALFQAMGGSWWKTT